MLKDFLQKAGAVAALGMFTIPIGLETMPVAFLQSLNGLVFWYAIATALVGLVGWSLPDDGK